MILTKEEIDEIRNRGIMIDDEMVIIYKKFDRSPIETLKLFKYAIGLLENSNNNIERLSNLKNKVNSLIIEWDLKLNSKWYLEFTMSRLLKDNLDIIDQINDLVFREEEGGGINEID